MNNQNSSCGCIQFRQVPKSIKYVKLGNDYSDLKVIDSKSNKRKDGFKKWNTEFYTMK